MNFKKLKEDGFIKIKNFLDNNELVYLRDKLKISQFEKGDPRSHFDTNYRFLLHNLFTLNFKRIYQNEYLLKLARKKKLKNIADIYFKKKSNIVMIDSYKTGISNNELLPWHTDMAYEGRENIIKFYHPDDFKLKILIYLTDVGPENGCTSYINKSHKITYIVRKLIYEKKIKYKPYFLIHQLRTVLMNNSKLINQYAGKDIVNEFFINTETENISKFDFTLNKGDAIIFDEGGFHKVSKTTSERMILRYLLSSYKN